MPPSARELTERAERAVRRGELLVAIELFESALAEDPDDERVRHRMESVRALLHPSELVNRRRAEPEELETGPVEPLAPAEEGELHASAGRFADALRCYERAAAQTPTNQLVLERLEELRNLAPPAPGARADLASAEKLPAVAAAHAPGARSARVVQASFAPLADRAPPPARKDKATLLRELLDRVRAGRRNATSDA
jgi:tetratricopeptide (TPR) repeat protein